MAYLQQARQHIGAFMEVETLPERGQHQPPYVGNINSRIDLLGSHRLTKQWWLFYNLYQIVYAEKMTTEMGSEPVLISPEDPMVVQVADELKLAGEALREEVGTRARLTR